MNLYYSNYWIYIYNFLISFYSPCFCEYSKLVNSSSPIFFKYLAFSSYKREHSFYNWFNLKFSTAYPDPSMALSSNSETFDLLSSVWDWIKFSCYSLIFRFWSSMIRLQSLTSLSNCAVTFTYSRNLSSFSSISFFNLKTSWDSYSFLLR